MFGHRQWLGGCFSQKLLSQFLQIRRELADSLISLRTVLAQRFRYQLLKLAWHVVEEPKPGGLSSQNQGDDLVSRAGFERRDSGDHLVQDYSETPDVRSYVHRTLAQMLRRHIPDRAHLCARFSVHVRDSRVLVDVLPPGVAFVQLGQTKVQHLNVAVLTEHYVFRFDIAMDHA